MHTDTCRKTDLQAGAILDVERSLRCLLEVLRGSSVSFRSNALFVDKSKLMVVKREAFGGKNSVDPSQIEFDHSTGYQQLQK